MAKSDLLRVEGVVSQALSGSAFLVRLNDGRELMAKLSGKLRRFHIRILVGDKVTLGLSYYDITHGLILSRERLNNYSR